MRQKWHTQIYFHNFLYILLNYLYFILSCVLIQSKEKTPIFITISFDDIEVWRYFQKNAFLSPFLQLIFSKKIFYLKDKKGRVAASP